MGVTKILNSDRLYSTATFLQKYIVRKKPLLISKEEGFLLYKYLYKYSPAQLFPQIGITQVPLFSQKKPKELILIIGKNKDLVLITQNISNNSKIIAFKQYSGFFFWLIKYIQQLGGKIKIIGGEIYIVFGKNKKVLLFVFLFFIVYLNRKIIFQVFKKLILYFLKNRIKDRNLQKGTKNKNEGLFSRPRNPLLFCYSDEIEVVEKQSDYKFFEEFLENLQYEMKTTTKPWNVVVECQRKLKNKKLSNKKIISCARDMIDAITFKFCTDSAYEECIRKIAVKYNPKIYSKCINENFSPECQLPLLEESLLALYTQCFGILSKTKCAGDLQLLLERLIKEFIKKQK